MRKSNFQDPTKAYSNNSILVISPVGIYRLFCPFKAVCLIEVEFYSAGQEVVVMGVKTDVNSKLIYLIENRAYYYYHFSIISQFKPPARSLK